MREPPSEFQAAGSKPHPFWFHGKVPVGICHMPVPQERRQHRQAALDILIGPVPLDQRAYGESMPKIVQPRTLVILRPAQANLPRQIVKRSAHCGTLQAAAVVIEKETGRRWAAQKPAAAPGVIGHDVPSGIVEWNQAGLAELGLADGEDTVA